MTILCICTYFKGVDFLRSAKDAGNKILLITNKKLEHSAWPRESVDEFFYLEHVDNTFDTYRNLIEGVAYINKTRKIDMVVALDDFDVEKAALVREHFRIPGMGQTTARYFRDKLAMRIQARDSGIPVPEFSPLFNDVAITTFLETVPGPWLVKPRSEASAAGIKKVFSKDEAWAHIHSLGEERHNFLIESFKPGDVFHIDSLIYNRKVIFERCSQYLDTPFEVAHGGGIFRTATLEPDSLENEALSLINNQVIKAFGLKYSASHTEVIRSKETGEYYFLETASRVGGAQIAEMIEFSSGVNLWGEWAKIESSMGNKEKYKLPKASKDHGGILITLSKHKHPDMSAFNDPEIVWRMDEEYHLGLIVKSPSRERVLELLNKYAKMVHEMDFHASAPAPDKPMH